MPVDFNAPEGTTTPQNDGSMFAPTPIWEQRAKARRRGRRMTPSPEQDVQQTSIDDFGPTAAADAADESDGFRYDPIRTEHRRSGVPAGVIAGGVAAIALVAALGWYMNRPSDRGMPELTPGAPGTGEVAMAAPPLSPLPTSAAGAPPGAPVGVTPQMAAISPSREAAPAATAKSSERATRSAQTASRTERSSRVRPATANSAQEEGIDASATAPVINLPAASGDAKGPTLDMPAEKIAPHLDPTLPSNSGAQAPSTGAPTTGAPVAGDVTTP